MRSHRQRKRAALILVVTILVLSGGSFVYAGGVVINLAGDARIAELLPLNIRYQEVGFQPDLLIGKEADRLIKTLEQLPPGGLKINKTGGCYLIAF